MEGVQIMNRFIPQLWADALAQKHLATANAMYHAIQEETDDFWRTCLKADLVYALGCLIALGRTAVLRDGYYQFEEEKPT